MSRWLCLASLALGGCVVYERGPVPRPADPPLSREELARLLAAGVSEGVLREQVALRGAEPLDADAVAALKKAGASDDLLQRLILAVRVPPPPPEPVVVERAYYYGWSPVYASVGFGFGVSSYRRYPRARGIRVYR